MPVLLNLLVNETLLPKDHGALRWGNNFPLQVSIRSEFFPLSPTGSNWDPGRLGSLAFLLDINKFKSQNMETTVLPKCMMLTAPTQSRS
jgi:hypothetical protein